MNGVVTAGVEPAYATWGQPMSGTPVMTATFVTNARRYSVYELIMSDWNARAFVDVLQTLNVNEGHDQTIHLIVGQLAL